MISYEQAEVMFAQDQLALAWSVAEKGRRQALDIIEQYLRELMPGPAIPLAIIYQGDLPVGIECVGRIALYPFAGDGPRWMEAP